MYFCVTFMPAQLVFSARTCVCFANNKFISTINKLRFLKLDKFENNFWIGEEAASAPETSSHARVMVRMQFGQNVYEYLPCLLKNLPEQLGLRRYAINTHLDEFVPEPALKKSWIRLWTVCKYAFRIRCCSKNGLADLQWGYHYYF